jgi:uncharacterized membrane protein
LNKVLKVPLFSRKDFFSTEEKNQIVAAIRQAEQQTSGEVRVYVESHCRFVDPLDRAAEVFWLLKMENTEARNAVLVYVAVKDRQLAIFGDKGIHEKVGEVFWTREVNQIISQFRRDSYADAIVKMIRDIGEALKFHFPYNRDTDVNELPDDIVFGR